MPPRVLIAIALLLAVLAGAWLWLRDSSLVGVRHVTVVGVSGPDAPEIRSALVASARNMSTLDVQMGHLRTAVAPYPVVKGLQVRTHLPHAMTIRVVEQVPVAEVVAVGRRITVSADGTLLRDVPASSALPSIVVGVPPGGTHLTGSARRQVALLAAAPYGWLGKIEEVSGDSTHGLVAQLRDGPKIYFGAPDHLRDKWDAVSQVLADPAAAGASYIDVSVPSRPAAGTGADSPTAPGGAAGSAAGSVITPSSSGGAGGSAATTSSGG